jgi:hypothetical protein
MNPQEPFKLSQILANNHKVFSGSYCRNFDKITHKKLFLFDVCRVSAALNIYQPFTVFGRAA